MSNRPSWDEYFIGIARLVAARSTCTRRAVGAVLVRQKRILTTGYNGAPADLPHCHDVGCLLVDGHCVRTVHAEQNAVVQAALHGLNIHTATLYCTSQPCFNCAKIVIAAGIKRIVFADPYEDPLAIQFFREAQVELVHHYVPHLVFATPDAPETC